MTNTENAEAKAPAEINVEDFAGLVANMSRLLTGLARIKPFSDADLGLAEWVTLSMLAQKDGVSNKQLGRNLGVTGQRVNQISASLTKAGLIAVSQSAEDNRANEIKITATGKARIDAVNSQLKPLLSVALKGREGAVGSAGKQLRHVMRLLQAGTVDAGQAKQGKKEKKARKAAKAEAAGKAS
jgi:DNA-binding MarR family transcriptional regulator